jgi:hypothetical protein
VCSVLRVIGVRPSQAGFVENTPDAIAQFLRKTPALDLKSIGEIIGGPKDQNKVCVGGWGRV